MTLASTMIWLASVAVSVEGALPSDPLGWVIGPTAFFLAAIMACADMEQFSNGNIGDEK